jgi:hypothetical protein
MIARFACQVTNKWCILNLTIKNWNYVVTIIAGHGNTKKHIFNIFYLFWILNIKCIELVNKKQTIIFKNRKFIYHKKNEN